MSQAAHRRPQGDPRRLRATLPQVTGLPSARRSSSVRHGRLVPAAAPALGLPSLPSDPPPNPPTLPAPWPRPLPGLRPPWLRAGPQPRPAHRSRPPHSARPTCPSPCSLSSVMPPGPGPDHPPSFAGLSRSRTPESAAPSASRGRPGLTACHGGPTGPGPSPGHTVLEDTGCDFSVLRAQMRTTPARPSPPMSKQARTDRPGAARWGSAPLPTAWWREARSARGPPAPERSFPRASPTATSGAAGTGGTARGENENVPNPGAVRTEGGKIIFNANQSSKHMR